MTSKTSDLMTEARNKLAAAQAAHKAGDTARRETSDTPAPAPVAPILRWCPHCETDEHDDCMHPET